MNYVEITGQPCSGKTTFLAGNSVFDLKRQVLCQNSLSRILNFFRGVLYLGIGRLMILLAWSKKEEVSFLFRLNIFRNAVSKFGVFKYLKDEKTDSKSTNVVDEGISHLPFLFQNTHSSLILDFISGELTNIGVIFLKSPGKEELIKRLKKRGHKRLRFLSVDEFVVTNNKIETYLIHRYPHNCRNFRTLDGDNFIQ